MATGSVQPTNNAPGTKHDNGSKTRSWLSSSLQSFDLDLEDILEQLNHKKKPIDSQRMARDHNQAYNQGNLQGMSPESMGDAAVVEVMKQLQSAGPSVSKEQFLRSGINEAKKLNDKAGGSKDQEQAIIVQVAMTIVHIVEESGETLEVSISVTLAAISKFF